ncbi:endonuclease NucS domain-containing protein [Chamaesiphon sp. VAR_48_metabat_135_sub]|uniref:endonuclease NucS domain-containing protein n=1 Tax=Chamaesiphon sp. VAR_48_metabat_135_sub TaxID=2964699 RepID=UPI00286B59C4|nr:endonuclease NucS domain-containing protein [Chamaesiphon sp. VAR_48_metabat_135_sub]
MLNKVRDKVEFKSEAELEKFVYGHLDELLALQPIAKQYRVNGDICDILAVDDRQQLSIIELKNVEDRYIVQQLTRYYESLIEEKPFSNLINYENEIRLIAITPSFHQHNLIDRKHTRLEIEFWSFDIAQVKGTKNILFTLSNCDTNEKNTSQISTGRNDDVLPKEKVQKTEIEWSEDPAERWKQYVMVNAPYIDAVDYYMRLNYSSKLAIQTLTAEEVREKSKKYKRACTKEFKIKLELLSKESGITRKFKTVKLPQNIQLGHLAAWCIENKVPNAIEVRYNQSLMQVQSSEHRIKVEAFIAHHLSLLGVESNPDIADGRTCILNTKIPIWVLVAMREMLDYSDEEIHALYPNLSEIELENAWAHASDYARTIRSETGDIFEYLTTHKMW